MSYTNDIAKAHRASWSSKEGNVTRQKSETRQLTELVAVRFAPSDLDALRQEASRRDMSVPQLLREVTLGTLRTAS
jgi:predicted DNA binding CopG/RHH family protein